MKMKKTDIGVVAFMYAVCAFFYACSSKLTAESKTYPMFTIALLFALTTLYLIQMIISARKFGVESGGDLGCLFASPVSWVLIILSIIGIFSPIFMAKFEKKVSGGEVLEE